MHQFHHLLNVLRQLSPWMLAGFAGAVSLLFGWAYLRTLRILPWMNYPMLGVGLLLLILEPVVAMKGDQVAAPGGNPALVSALIALGTFLLTLGVAGRWVIRRESAKELLHRQLWDRYPEL